jgi:hypothetical protein
LGGGTIVTVVGVVGGGGLVVEVEVDVDVVGRSATGGGCTYS